jgi:hemerythrin-like domain-containing protein
MNAIKLLKQQHDEVKELLEKLEDTSDTALKSRAALFAKVADALAGHAEIEERIFYPAMQAPNTEAMLSEGLEEHLSVKRLIADLLEMAPDDETFIAKCTVLREQVEHHIEEEEGELFKEAKKLLKSAELEEMGAKMEKMYEFVLQNAPRMKVPGQTDKAPHLP